MTKRTKIALISSAAVFGLGGVGALLEETDREPTAASSSISTSPTPTASPSPATSPSPAASSPSPVLTEAPTQTVSDPADATPAVVDLRRVRAVAGQDGLTVTWTAAATIPQQPGDRLFYAFTVERFDASGNGDSWQVAANWPGDGWVASVFAFSEARQEALVPPSLSGRSITVRVPWDLIGGRRSFEWNAASEAGDDVNNDEVKGGAFDF